MEEYECSNLAEIRDALKDIEQRIQTLWKKSGFGEMPTLLFRGHGSDQWKLQTTLERFTCENFSLPDYQSALRKISSEISTATGQRWTFGDFDNIYKFGTPSYDLPDLGFMVYARHHGFPSPLLDWTRSIYVALFFAFQSKIENTNFTSIHVFVDNIGCKVGSDEEASIFKTECNQVSHPRHNDQQAEYTFSAKKVGSDWVYCSVEEALVHSVGFNQDIIFKIRVPLEARTEILKELFFMNITPYSLYRSEDSLMETMALKEILLKNS